MLNVGQAIGYLDLDTSGFKTGFQSAFQDLKTFQDETATVGDKLAALGSAFTNSGKTLTTNVTLPIVGIGTAATTVAANFESAMSKVQSISGASGDDLERLSDKAKEMGASTKFSASESAQALQYMAMAGWKTEDMIDGLDGVIQLAAASGEDLALTSDILTDALTAFGLQAKDAGKFADVLAAASSNANTNVSMLGESFKYVAPVAGALKFSAEDTAVALGLMANNGIKASQAGTALRTFLANLTKPTDDMAYAMEVLGIGLTDADGNMRSLMEIMEQVRSGFNGGQITQEQYNAGVERLKRELADGTIEMSNYYNAMESLDIALNGATEAQKAQLASTLAGKEGMSGLLAIVNSSNQDFQKLTEAIYGADGAAKTMADTQMNNLQGRTTVLKSALEGLAISFGELLLPAITKVTKTITSLVDWLNSLDEGTKERIVQMAAIVAAIGPVLLIVGKLISVVTTVIHLFSMLKPAIIAVNAVLAANPIGIVIIALTALGAALVTLYKKNEDFRNSVDGTWRGIKQVFTTAVNGITNVLMGIPQKIEQIGAFVMSIPDKANNIGLQIVRGLWNGINGATSWLKEKISGFAGGIINGFKRAFGIASPAKKLMPVGRFVNEGLAVGLEKSKNTVLDSVSELSDDVLAEYNKIPKGMDTSNFPLYNAQSAANSLSRGFNLPYQTSVLSFMQEIVTSLNDLTGSFGVSRALTIVINLQGRTIGTTTVEDINSLSRETGKLVLNI